MTAPHPALEHPGLTLDELAELLNIPKGTLRAKVISGEWPCHRPGRHIRFYGDDISAILAATKAPATAAVTQPAPRKVAAGLAKLDRAAAANRRRGVA